MMRLGQVLTAIFVSFGTLCLATFSQEATAQERTWLRKLTHRRSSVRRYAARSLLHQRSTQTMRAVKQICKRAKSNRRKEACGLLRAWRQPIVHRVRKQRWSRGGCRIDRVKGKVTPTLAQELACPPVSIRGSFRFERIQCGALVLGRLDVGPKRAWHCIARDETYKYIGGWKRYVSIRHTSRRPTGLWSPSTLARNVQRWRTYDRKTGKLAPLAAVYPKHHEAILKAAKSRFRELYVARGFSPKGAGRYERRRDDRIERVTFRPGAAGRFVIGRKKSTIVGFAVLREDAIGNAKVRELEASSKLLYVAVPRSVGAIARAARSGDPRVRIASIVALGRMGEQGAKGVLSLRRLLLYPKLSNETHREVLVALGRIGPKAWRSIYTVLKSFTEPPPGGRLEKAAAVALGRMGPKVVSGLLWGIRQQNRVIRGISQGALRRMGAAPVPQMVRLLKRSRSRYTRRRVMAALALLGPNAAGAVDVLLPLLKHKRTGLRQFAVRTLGAIGTKARRASAALLGASRDKASEVRVEAVVALGRLGLAPSKLLPVYMRALGDHDPGVRRGAAIALRRHLSLADKAIPALIQTLHFGMARSDAAITLGLMGRRARAAIPALQRILRSNPLIHRRSALKALQGIGPASVYAMLYGIQRELPGSSVWKQAIRALRQMKDKATPGVRKGLSDASPAVRRVAAMVSGALGPYASGLVSALEASLRDKEAAVQAAAVAALGQIGPKASSALAALRQILPQLPPEHRTPCRQVIQKLGQFRAN